MRLLCPGIERNDTGGGSSFLKNFQKAMHMLGHECIGYTNVTPESYDILFIAGATLCDRLVVEQAVQYKKPIVLRVDNILEDKKNRNGGMPRMLEYAKAADVIVYQSDWAKRFLGPVLGDGMVIYNGVDTDVFRPLEGKVKKTTNEEHVFFYTKYSRGEGKNVNVVQQWWREWCIGRGKKDVMLFCGRFADDNFNVNHPFEFHNQERFEFVGVAKDQDEMREVMQDADCAVLPYFSDACSNSILEAQACGLYVLYNESGGTPEIIYPGMGEPLKMNIWENKDELVERIDLAIRNFDRNAFKNTYGLEKMARQYHGVFQTITMPVHEL